MSGGWTSAGLPATTQSGYNKTMITDKRAAFILSSLIPGSTTSARPASPDLATRPLDVLVVDPEEGGRFTLAAGLSAQGFAVAHARRGDAVAILRQLQPVLAIVTVSSEQSASLDVVVALRSESNLPIIVLAEDDDASVRYLSLELGADDCVTARCSPRELEARIRSVLRRYRREPVRRPSIDAGNVHIDSSGRTVTVAGKAIEIGLKEFGLLSVLAAHAGTTCSHEELLRAAWSQEENADPGTLRVHIAWLRRKLRSSNVTIETIWGVGYRLLIRD